jgi:hypothetical protein
MSMMKRQLETLAARVNNGDITITDELMAIVEKHEIRQEDTSVCWSWVNEHGNKVAGGIGALANWINNDCHSTHYLRPRNHIRLSCDANGKCWTTANGG